MTPTLLLPLLFVGVLGGGAGGKCASWCLRPFARAWACETEYCAGCRSECNALPPVVPYTTGVPGHRPKLRPWPSSVVTCFIIIPSCDSCDDSFSWR